MASRILTLLLIPALFVFSGITHSAGNDLFNISSEPIQIFPKGSNPDEVSPSNIKQLIYKLRKTDKLLGIDQASINVFETEASNCVECTLDFFRKTSNKRDPMNGMCQIITKSEICKSVKKSDLINCANWKAPENSLNFSVIKGCSEGIFNSAVTILKFLWRASKGTFNVVTHPTQFKKEAVEYMESSKLYFVNEYDKAYNKEKEGSTRALRAATVISFQTIDVIIKSVKTYLEEEFHEFGCFNDRARTEAICNVIGSIFIPSTGAIAVLKYDSKAIKLSGKSLKESIKKNTAVNTKTLAITQKAPLDRAEELLGKKLTESQVKALDKAHLIGTGKSGKNGQVAGLGNYTPAQLRNKSKTLKDAGFLKEDIRKLIEDGVVGVGTSEDFSTLLINQIRIKPKVPK